MSQSRTLSSLLKAHWPQLSGDAHERLVTFHELVLAESQKQNLTRLLKAEDFWAGHLLDVRELLQARFLGAGAAADFGSGVGVPGLAAACVEERLWLLLESEGRKADFLAAAVEKLALKQVMVFRERGEKVLSQQTVSTICSRAVGSASKLYDLVRRSSTWNNLILFKGPGWPSEWEEFNLSSKKGKLKILATHPYAGGLEGEKARVLIHLTRVR